MMKPIGDKIVVKRDDAPTMSEGGIELPVSSQKLPCEGTVVAVGPGKMRDNGERTPMQTQVADRVMFGSYAGTDAKHEGKVYLVMSEDDVIAILE